MRKDDKGAVVVSGSSRGIGAAISIELASIGYPIVVNYSRNREEAEEILKRIKEIEGKGITFQADVAEEESIREMVSETLSRFGKIAGAVNNASGEAEIIGFADLEWADIQRQIDIQVKGTFHLCQAILPHLLKNNGGVIVNIASVFADNTPPTKQLPYTLAKSAIISFSRSLAVEYGPKGIRVNCLSPGMTLTRLIENIPEKAKMLHKMQTPLRKLAEPEDIAGPVAFLFSDKARHITGQNLRVCGGIVMS